MKDMSLKQESIVEAAKATPAVAGAAYSSLTLNEWVAAATLVYIIIQAGVLVHKHYCFIKDRRKVTVAKVKDKIDELDGEYE